MAVFLQSTSEENLYLCIMYGLWGAPNKKLKAWRAGDQLIAYVERDLAALFTVTSQVFRDETEILEKWSLSL